MNFKSYAFSILLALASTSTSQAVISVVNTAPFTNGGSNLSAATYGFNAFGANKLVIVVTGEAGNPGQMSNGVSNVTFDGVSLTQVVDRNSIPESSLGAGDWDQTYNDIWYLDASAYTGGAFTNATLNIAISGGQRGHLSVIALAGTADGAGNSVIGPRDSNSASLTTSAGSIVIASYGTGGNGNTGSIAGVSWNGDVEVSAQVQSNWNGQVVGYSNDVAAGTASYSFTDPDAAGAHVIAAEFLIPEPSVALLGSLGLLALLRRRR